MKKTLTPIGTDLGIIIDKPILDLLGIDTDTLLEVSTDGAGLIIKPVDGALSVGANGHSSLPEPSIDDLDLAIDSPPEVSARSKAPDLDELPKSKTRSKTPAPLPPADRSQEAPVGPAPPPLDVPDPISKVQRPPTASSPAAASQSSVAAGKPVLVITQNDTEVMRVDFETDQMVIGREADKVDLHLDDRALSRKHLRIEKRGAAIWVNDLGSANGTFVNGERVREPQRLEAGDIIEVGHYRIHVEGLEERDLSDTPVLTLNGPEGLHRFAMVGDQIVIGRSHSCDISIGHKSISRRHIKILIESGNFIVEDLGSQNGCKLNGKRLKGKAPFAIGDVVSMCDFSLELGYLDDQATDDAPHRPRTMLIDASVMAGAAYVDGDMQNLRSDAGQMHVGREQQAKPDTGEYSVPN